jgi:pimeloyl-ACP methyl ester carboxylesterase
MPRARVVLVHGIRTSATMWRGQVARLSRHDIEVVPIDLPGHGARIGEPFTLEAAFEVIASALAGDSAPPGPGAADDGSAPPVPRLLVGLSLGGYLAIEFAARHPDSLDGLIAASCSTRPRGPAIAGYRRLAALIARLPDRGRALNDVMARVFLPPAAVSDVIAGGVALDVMQPTLAAVGELDPERSLAAVEVPVWIVNGRYDHFRLEERRMLRASPHAQRVIIDRATHLVSLARPDDFAAAVLGAVAELERRAARTRRAG